MHFISPKKLDGVQLRVLDNFTIQYNIKITTLFLFILLQFFIVPPVYAEISTLNCKALKQASAVIAPGPDLQISPESAHLWIPRAYVRNFRKEATQNLIATSGRLSALFPSFLPYDVKDDPGILGKGWGNTVSIFFEKPINNSNVDRLPYFLAQTTGQKAQKDEIGFDVFTLQHGLDGADELHLAPDQRQYVLCSNLPQAKYHHCLYIFQKIDTNTFKFNFGREHLSEFIANLEEVPQFLGCLNQYK